MYSPRKKLLLGPGAILLLLLCLTPFTVIAQGSGDDGVEPSISPSPSAINTDSLLLLPMESTQTQDTSPTPTPPPEVDGSGSGSTSFFMMCRVVNDTNYTFTVTIELGTAQTSIGKIGALVYYDEIQKEYYDAQLELEQHFPFMLNSDEIVLVERITATSNFSLSLLVFPMQEAPSYCMSEDIQIIVTVTVISTPPVCEFQGPPRIEAYQYDSISAALEELNCLTTVSVPILYRMTTESDIEAYVHEAEFSPIFADYFSVGEHVSSITVCNGLFGSCNDTEISVTLTINPHKDRLFPFGSNYFNLAIENADDYASSITVPNGIPFWTGYYSRIYISTNGLVSFNRPFTSWYPIPFPYGQRQVPIIAPYWTDFDFRESSSAVYYHVYEKDTDVYVNRAMEILMTFTTRLDTYSNSVAADFYPDWMLVVTWYNSTPYYGRDNEEETVTFQLVLATDYISTYAFFLYEEGGFNWNIANRQRQRIVIGYDARDYINYDNIQLNDQLSDITSILQIDTVEGNTNLTGQWYLNLTSQEGDERNCLKWAKRQPTNVLDNFEGLPACPCTRRQAWTDWRFLFAFYWGYSSQPNCATLLFSRRQSTIECCYNTDGSLIVGSNSGGSYKLYNSLFFPQEYSREDQLPHDYCCVFSNRCSIFYEHRPSDDCSNYVTQGICFTWGDPHFRSVDDNPFIFNGIGDYSLLESPGNGLVVHARFTQFNDANGTVMSGLAVKQGNSQTVRIEIESKVLQVYIGETIYGLPENNTLLWINDTETYSDAAAFLSNGGDLNSTDLITLRSDNGTLILTTPAGASISVSTQLSFLHSSIELSDEFLGDTRGLLGYYNGDATDDFLLPNGRFLPSNLTEMEVYKQFGLLWHLNRTESLFPQGTYDMYNMGWDTFVPAFSSALTGSPPEQCGNDTSCIYDYSVTGSLEVGVSSMTVSMENDENMQTLENPPPNITGTFIVYVDTNMSFSELYTAEDEDGVDYFNLNEPIPSGFELMGTGNTKTLVWSMPGLELPSVAIQLISNDTNGATTSRLVNVILCACTNNGNCSNVSDVTPLFNDNGHYKLPCDCPDNFDGDSCEIDTRGCTLDPCPQYSVCAENDTAPQGYFCTDCEDGYALGAEEKCVDIDECNTTVIEHMDNCSQICINTDGSYECHCEPGYRLLSDGISCQDIDECYEGLQECNPDHICTNTNGSYECSCHSVFLTLPGDPIMCVSGFCPMNPCADGSCSMLDSTLFCTCSVGQYCDGICEGTFLELDPETQTCIDCPTGTYGFNCSQTCNCMNGYCDVMEGCMCEEGWEGTDCNIEINMFDPVFAQDTPTTLYLPWDLPSQSVVTQIIATDNDTNPNTGRVSFFLRVSPFGLSNDTSNGTNVFELEEESGVIKLTQNLNASQGIYSQFVLTIEASDNGMVPRFVQITLVIIPMSTVLPEPIFSLSEYFIIVRENTPINSTILNLTCTETNPTSDPNDLIITSIPGNDTDFFDLEGGSSIVVIQELDYEAFSDPFFTLEFRCTNPYNLTGRGLVRIEIENIDDNDFMFDNETYLVSIPEDIMPDEIILVVRAFDADDPDADIYYTLGSQTSTYFAIGFETGEIIVLQTLDRETTEELILSVNATKGLPFSMVSTVSPATINVTLLDVNDNPPIFDPTLYFQHNITTRNELGDTIVIVHATDDDKAENGTVNYQLEDNLFFVINESTGRVFINSSSITPGQFILNVSALDGGQPPLSASTIIDIIVRSSPERIEINNLTISILENHPRGATITTLEARIIHDNGDNITGVVNYQIVGGTDTGPFHIVENTGTLVLLTSLNFEQVQTYLLEIEISLPDDPIVSPVMVVARINLIDVNDNAPVFVPSFYTTTIQEFTELGTVIAFDQSINAMDDDSTTNGEITYRLQEGFPFEIDDQLGVLTVSGALDMPRDYRFNVIAEDGGTPQMSSQAVVFISVVRSVSVTPLFTRDHYIFNISEYTTIGSSLGSVMAVTEGNRSIEDYPHLLYRIRIPGTSGDEEGSTDGDTFHIDGNFGNISTLSMFDAEVQQNYAFYVEVYNATSEEEETLAIASVQVQILDENDNAPIFSQSLYTAVITTSTQIYTRVLTVSAQDQDFGSNSQLEYKLISDVLGFHIHPNGNITVSNDTLYAGDYRLTAVATDQGLPPQEGTATIFIAIIPATPTSINFSQTDYGFQVLEDATAGTFVGRVEAVDNENATISGGQITYSFSNPNISDCFHISDDGNISVACTTLDRESVAIYELVVMAKFTSGNTSHSDEVEVVVELIDINDNDPMFILNIYSNVITAEHGNDQPVVTVKATDPDLNDNGEVRYNLYVDQGPELFRIDEITGDVFLINDTIPADDYKLVTIAHDLGTPQRNSSIALVLICVTQTPPSGLTFSIESLVHSISENQPTGAVVGTVVLITSGMPIILADYMNNLEFSIVATDGNDSSELFHINPINGTIRTVTGLDREEATTHVLQIKALFAEFDIQEMDTVTIHVLDENDNTPMFIPNVYSETIDDSYHIGDLVLTSVYVRDLDIGNNGQFTFSIDPGTPFGINTTSGDIFVANTSILLVDDYRFTIHATDNGTETLTGTAEVYVIVEHAVPESISFPPQPYNFTHVEASSPGTAVGTVLVEQTTPALDGLLYEITGGTGRLYFHVDPFSGAISNLREIDRETDTQFNLTITAFLPEMETLSATTQVTIDIDDVNDNRPIFVPSAYAVSVLTDVTTSEVLVNVTANDADIGSNQELQYTIIGSEPTMSFNINQEGDIFAISSPLAVATYHLVVSATDNGNPAMTGSAVVVINVREQVPISIQFTQTEYQFTSSEYSPSGSNIGIVALEPIPDMFTQNVDFETTSSEFSIAPTTGEIRSIIEFDYDQEDSYSFTVEAYLEIPNESPPISLTASATVVVTIMDENDNRPQFVNFPTTILFPENQTVEQFVQQIEVSDQDSGTNAEFTFEIINDVQLGGSFRIEDNGNLYVSASLDREVQETYNLYIRVSDKGDPPQTNDDTVTFTLEDINDNIPLLTSGFTYEVRERLPATTVVFTLTYEDPDEGENGRAVWALGDGADGLFSLGIETGVVSLLTELDYEDQPSYSVTVTLQDNINGPDSNEADYDLVIMVIDEPDNPPKFSVPSYQYTVLPTVSPDDIIGAVVATDLDGNSISFSITSIELTTGQGDTLQLSIDGTTGTISSSATVDQMLTPESVFTVMVEAVDDSQWTLSTIVLVTIEVVPESLMFTESSYNVEISENAAVGTTVTILPIETESVSSDITYSIVVTDSNGNMHNGVFSPVERDSEVAIRLNSKLDREDVDGYSIQVTAMRPADPLTGRPDETATTTLSVDVQDFNDNIPVFTDVKKVLVVRENSPSQTVIGKINATDQDAGNNGIVDFSFVNPPVDLPFTINTNGEIVVSGAVDYEMDQTFSLIVRARDGGTPTMSDTATYTINVTNVNDNFPQFAAPAYFGEVYAGAPDNYHIHHVVLEVTDLDDEHREQQISFDIFLPPGSGRTGYELQVTDRQPYYIVAVSIPNSAQTGIIEFTIEVRDEGGLTTPVPLYLSVFTSNYLIPFTLNGVTEDEFLSCTDQETSVCAFTETVSDVISDLLDADTAFYNDSVRESEGNSRILVVAMYGWYGTFDDNRYGRNRNGQLLSNAMPPAVTYIQYAGDLEENLAAAITSEFNEFDFGVILDESTTEPPTTTATEGSSDTIDPVIVGVAVGGAIAALLIILIIVLVVVFGRRRQPKRKGRGRDPYDRDYSRSRSRRRLHKSKTPRKGSDFATSDLAYETMYDDEEIMGTHTMPWFDPKYLATNKEEQYEGDTELSGPNNQRGNKSRFKATVDGNARRNRRFSSDESAGAESTTELDHTNYLRGYQQSTPLQPGQRMGEFDMFAQPRDPDKPYRPPLQELQWKQQHKTSQM